MRLLLSLVGAAALVAVGWICWRATAETRQWREFLALGTKTKHSQDEWDRFLLLGQEIFPQERPYRTVGVTILNGTPARRVLVLLRWRGGATGARLYVLDEDGGRRSSSDVPSGPCGVACRPSPGRGAWAFDIAQLTPGADLVNEYELVDDLPVLIRPAGE